MLWGKIRDLSNYEKLREINIIIDKDIVKELSSDSSIKNLYLAKGEVYTYFSVVWNKLYTRKLINNVLFKSLPTKDVAQDLEYNSRVYQQTTKAILCTSRLYYYIQRPSSFQHQGISLRWINVVQATYLCLCDIPKSNKKYRSYCLRFLYHMMYGRCYWSRNTSYHQAALDNQKHYLKCTIKEFVSNLHIPIFEKIGLIILNYIPLLSICWISTLEWIVRLKNRI